MFTKLTTTVMAGALALASAATPTEVRAGSEARNIIAGLAVGAIVGAAIASQSNKKTKHRGGRHVSRGHHNGYHAGYPDAYGGGQHRGHKNRRGYRDKHVNLPGACRVHKGHRSGYSGRCLSGYNYSHAAMPAACAVRVGGRHGTIYRDGCLNRHGYY